MTTALDMAAYVGRTGTVGHFGMQVAVTVANVKTAYGRTLYYVTPHAGKGGAWVERGNLTLDV